MLASSPTILLVDDDPIALEVNMTALKSTGFTSVLALDDSRSLLPLLESRPVSAIILDLKMPHLPGTELLPLLIRDHPQIPIIVMTSSDDLETAVTCMRAGAADYLTKPMDAGRVRHSIEKALKLGELSRENRKLGEYLLNDNLEEPEAFREIITSSKKMRAIFQYIEVVARSDQPVLISGETGTGKELVARAVARLSGRRGNFVTVNVAGLDDTLFSDTLFGHKKGAFTGADQARDGLVSAAASGSLFLDEIGDLSECSQVKLLRLIQEQEYYPTGSDVLKACEARIIVATNHDLAERITAGTFRKDLYYRLCAHKIHIPPLRERREDIPLLLDHFTEMAASSLNKSKPATSREVVAMLTTCHFEGNVRELHGMVFDAVARHTAGPLMLEHFSGLNRRPLKAAFDTIRQEPGDLERALYAQFGRFPTIREMEDYLIASSMSLTGGNQRSAASLLGIARQTLSKRLNGGDTADTNLAADKSGREQFTLFAPPCAEVAGSDIGKNIATA